jgi:DNA-binding NarL/FixJ family response regulator
MSDHSDDERLALEFLEAERPLKPARERLARDALVRLLLDEKRPLPRSIRFNLAFLFETYLNNFPPQQLVIQNRRRGVRPTPHAEMGAEVAEAVKRGIKVGAAVTEVAKKYKVSERTVRRGWKDAQVVYVLNDKIPT